MVANLHNIGHSIAIPDALVAEFLPIDLSGGGSLAKGDESMSPNVGEE